MPRISTTGVCIIANGYSSPIFSVNVVKATNYSRGDRAQRKAGAYRYFGTNGTLSLPEEISWRVSSIFFKVSSPNLSLTVELVFT